MYFKCIIFLLFFVSTVGCESYQSANNCSVAVRIFTEDDTAISGQDFTAVNTIVEVNPAAKSHEIHLNVATVDNQVLNYYL